jgi:hypothetical protein
VFAGTFDRPALGMAQYNNNFGPGHLAGELHGSEYVLIQYITCYPYAENISQALIKHQFGACPGVNTTENNSKRVLSIPGVIDLLKQVPVHFEVVYKAHIAIFQQFKRIEGTQLVLNLFSECTHVGSFSSF